MTDQRIQGQQAEEQHADDEQTRVLDRVETTGVEVQRIIRSGTLWTAMAVIAPGIILGPMLASGWRPSQLPIAGAIAFWVGAVAAALGVALLIWAGCPALGFPLDVAHVQKVFCIRVGIVMNVSGMAVAGFVLLVAPVASS